MTGGYAIIEVTWNPKTRHWHPHMHVLAWSKYYDKRVLSDQWEAASKGSYIVDVKQVHTTGGVVHYLTKYLTKGVPDTVLRDPECFNAWLEAMQGSRLFIGFGSVPKLNEDPPDDGLENDWEPRHSLLDLLKKEAEGNAWAIAVMRQLRREPDEIDNLFDRDTG